MRRKKFFSLPHIISILAQNTHKMIIIFQLAGFYNLPLVDVARSWTVSKGFVYRSTIVDDDYCLLIVVL